MKKLSYANVMSTLALFITLGGTSYAAVTITGEHVKDGSLTSRDIQDFSIRPRDLTSVARTGSPGPTGSAGREGPAGQEGASGAQGVAGAPGPAGTQGPAGAAGRTGVQGPAGPQGPAGAQGPAGEGVDSIDFRPYEFGTAGITEQPLMEFFVGLFGQPGSMGVRSRHSNGHPKAGAQLYTRDYEDRYSIAMDYRDAAKPTLVSESSEPFLLKTGPGAAIVLDPSGYVIPHNDGPTPPRTAPAGRVEVNGYMTLTNLDEFPEGAPNGSLAMVENRIYLRAADEWVALVPEAQESHPGG